MIIKRLLILQTALMLGLGSVFVISSKAHPSPAGIALVLPRQVGDWSSDKDEPITEAERAGLAEDTGFARRRYTNIFGDEVTVGIVLSGSDMTNSIHRPERCLPAQGWTVMNSERLKIPMPADKPPLEVTKLTNMREFRLPNGTQPILVHNLSYYWFIGSRDVTASHLRRTVIDMQDRIVRGENQRWAYVTVAAVVTDNLKKYGGRSEQETARLIEELITQIVPEFKRPADNAASS